MLLPCDLIVSCTYMHASMQMEAVVGCHQAGGQSLRNIRGATTAGDLGF